MVTQRQQRAAGSTGGSGSDRISSPFLSTTGLFDLVLRFRAWLAGLALPGLPGAVLDSRQPAWSARARAARTAALAAQC